MSLEAAHHVPTLTQIADTHGIALPPERVVRLNELHQAARENARRNGSGLYMFAQNGLKIELSYPHSNARLDFTPDLHSSAPAESATRALFVLYFLRAAENFYLLAESGYLEKPAGFSATTNPRFASFLERNFGADVQPTSGSSVRVSAEYDRATARLISPEIRQMNTALLQRLGEVARQAD